MPSQYITLNEGQFNFEVEEAGLVSASKRNVPWVRPFSQDDLAVALRLAILEIARLKAEAFHG